jgi:signal transduction histidine kinase
MTARRRSILAVLVAGFSTAPAPLVGWRSGHLLSASHGLPQTLGFLVPGVLAIAARPDNKAARRLYAIGVVTAVGFSIGAVWSAYAGANPPAWTHPVVLALQGLDLSTGVLFLGLLAVFPDGMYQRTSERVVVLVGVGFVAAVLLVEKAASTTLTYPGMFVWTDAVTVPNPSAGFGLGVLGRVAWVAYQAGFLLLVVTGIVLLVLRFRRFGPRERGQVMWPLLGVVVTVLTIVVLGALGPSLRDRPDWVLYLLYAPTAMAVPLAIGFGMLRHELLGVDVLVRRSVAYGVLWLLVTGSCAAVALGIGLAVGGRVPVVLAIGLAVAATLAAEPVRRRLDRLSERLVFGHQATPSELIAGLGARLESAARPDDIAGTVAADVMVGLEASWVRVELWEPSGPVVGTAGDVPEDRAAALTVALVRGGEQLGEIGCGRRWDAPYRRADEQLLESLGRLAVLAVHSAHLADELAVRLDELGASRARIVAAQDEARRRLEHDLHDGVQQELVALLARLGLARHQLRRDPLLAEQTLELALDDGRRTLVSLQETARGIHPPVLSDHGLAAAVAERTSRLPVPVEVETALDGCGRFAPEVEGAAYFVVTEALGNVLKHSGASRAWVTLETTPNHALRVVVRDDGNGFDPAVVSLRGLVGLRDRIEAQGGTLAVVSEPGRGTCLTATVATGGGTDG